MVENANMILYFPKINSAWQRVNEVTPEFSASNVIMTVCGQLGQFYDPINYQLTLACLWSDKLSINNKINGSLWQNGQVCTHCPSNGVTSLLNHQHNWGKIMFLALWLTWLGKTEWSTISSNLIKLYFKGSNCWHWFGQWLVAKQAVHTATSMVPVSPLHWVMALSKTVISP